MGRALTFSDDRVIRLLRGYIPLAMDRRRPERTDPREKFFWRVVGQKPRMKFEGWEIETFPAAQGCYLFDGEGKLYAKANTHSDVIVDMLTKVRVEFSREPRKKSNAQGWDIPERQLAPPKDAVIARGHARILPKPKKGSALNLALGRDFMWIPRREIEALLRGRFPESFRNRLVLCHLRDFVRGEPGFWSEEHVEKSDFRAKAIEDAKEIRVVLSGSFRISAPRGTTDGENHWKGPSGYEGTLEGLLVYRRDKKKLTKFLLYAEGSCWGEVVFTPGAPPDKFPLKIAYVLAAENDRFAKVVAPYAAGEDGSYMKYGMPMR